jgi:hypothetical protein
MRTKTKIQHRQRPSPDIARVLHQLANRCEDPARFLELIYWSQEPELAELMRGFVSMSDEAKYTLLSFLRLAEGSLRSITIAVSEKGDITLSSSAVAGTLAVSYAPTRAKSPQPLH